MAAAEIAFDDETKDLARAVAQFGDRRSGHDSGASRR
jgi:hypothetical protein